MADISSTVAQKRLWWFGSKLSSCKQVGNSYLQLCHEIDKPAHEELVPVIHLSCHSAARAAEEAQQRQAHAVAAAAAGANNERTSMEVKRAVKLPPDDLYVSVVCNNVTAMLHPATCRVRAKGEEMSATQFEQYAGCGSAKKWRASVKLVPGQIPECPEGVAPLCFTLTCELTVSLNTALKAEEKGSLSTAEHNKMYLRAPRICNTLCHVQAPLQCRLESGSS